LLVYINLLIRRGEEILAPQNRILDLLKLFQTCVLESPS